MAAPRTRRAGPRAWNTLAIALVFGIVTIVMLAGIIGREREGGFRPLAAVAGEKMGTLLTTSSESSNTVAGVLGAAEVAMQIPAVPLEKPPEQHILRIDAVDDDVTPHSTAQPAAVSSAQRDVRVTIDPPGILAPLLRKETPLNLPDKCCLLTANQPTSPPAHRPAAGL